MDQKRAFTIKWTRSNTFQFLWSKIKSIPVKPLTKGNPSLSRQEVTLVKEIQAKVEVKVV